MPAWGLWRLAGTAALAAALLALAGPVAAQAAPVGSVKTVQGQVRIVRAGAEHVAAPAFAVHEADEIVTGADGLTGISFDDQTLLSLGPSSRFVIERYVYAQGAGTAARFDSSLARGTLAVVAGKIARSAAEAMKVRTPNAVLGVRGTLFIVEVAGKP